MSDYPFSYWVVIGVLLAGAVWSFQKIKEGTGIPMLAVIGTVAVWYVGDAYYNDYAHSYVSIFDSDVLQNAWLEVAWFLIVFLASVPYIHRRLNARYLNHPGGIFQLARFGVDQPFMQRQLNLLFVGCAAIYGVIALIATIRLGNQIEFFFFPFLGYKAEPWGRERIGSGFDALLSFALYVQLAVTAIFGVLAAVSTNWRTRGFSLILCFLSWPYFLFDRTRNTILAIVIPGILSWIFLRLRGGMWKKLLILAGCYVVVNGWMAFIIQNRSDESIAIAFAQKGFNLEKESDVHHQGLNMFEELCWINTFIKKGTYEPNWGSRYFAELVNPIPRALWHGKPLIGIDYAIARGQGERGQAGAKNDQGNVYATVSTGMIGQGVVNFGRFLGPAAAALLMAFWTALLAREDLRISHLGRLPLYAIGLILTFNLGRDITFITLYPFVFLSIVLWWIDRRQKRGAPNRSPAAVPAGVAAAAAPSSFPKPKAPVVRFGRKSVQRLAPRPKIITRSRPSRPPVSPRRPDGFPPRS